MTRPLQIHKPQFAVVREDPETDLRVIAKIPQAREVLVIGSGGCTALSIASRCSHIHQTLVEPNLTQVDLIQRKTAALRQRADLSCFNVESQDPKAFNQFGNFESIFRSWRLWIWEMVAPEMSWRSFFDGNEDASYTDFVFKNPYWSIAFKMFFHQDLLGAMFGHEAVQHAPEGSYPLHFQQAFEKALVRPDVRNNYFLHHILLGCYLNRSGCLPIYLQSPPSNADFEFVNGPIDHVKDFSVFDFIHLSNILDWMAEEKIRRVVDRLSSEMKSGSFLLVRQLNNTKPIESYFGPRIAFDASWGEELLRLDRSFFYTRMCPGRCQ